MTEPVSFSDAVCEWASKFFDDRTDRNPVVRTGKRDEIPQHVRRAVYLRDHGRCQWCPTDKWLQLDHIVPWSAGGSDKSDNLRLLCERCNEYRSNRYADQEFVKVRPCVLWCAECHKRDGFTPDESVRIDVFCTSCRRPSWTDNEHDLL